MLPFVIGRKGRVPPDILGLQPCMESNMIAKGYFSMVCHDLHQGYFKEVGMMQYLVDHGIK